MLVNTLVMTLLLPLKKQCRAEIVKPEIWYNEEVKYNSKDDLTSSGSRSKCRR